MRRCTLFVLLLGCVLCPDRTRAEDWPQWRYDAGRTAASPEELSPELFLQWVRHLPAPRPAWPKYPRLCFDAVYEPVVMGNSIFLPSMVTDSVTAFDIRSGARRWKYFTGGPVRFAPVAWNGRVYFVSDDGHLSCVDASEGKLLWRCRGLPPDRTDRKVLGNDRLISLWAARGGPVLRDGVIYFAAGVWPFEGVFVHALDAKTGKLLWSNRTSDAIPRALLDHNTRREGGLSPQGYLSLLGGQLIVPSGRAMPGVMDARTGALRPYSTQWGGRDDLQKGCWYVTGNERYFFLSGDMYDARTLSRIGIAAANEKELGEFREPIITPDTVYFSLPINWMQGYRPVGVGYQGTVAWDIATPPVIQKKQNGKRTEYVFAKRWELPGRLKVHIKAGARLYAGGDGVVCAVEPGAAEASPAVSWTTKIHGTPARMLAAGGRLFVVTREGGLWAFGPEKVEPTRYPKAIEKAESASRPLATAISRITERAKEAEGYCLVVGAGSSAVAEELVRVSKLHVIIIEPEVTSVHAARERFDKRGLYGTRVAVYQGEPATYALPPYLATLIISGDEPPENPSDELLLQTVLRSLHPYGGTAFLNVPAARQAAFAERVTACGSGDYEVSRRGAFAVVKRVRPPAGSAPWTHEDADAGNSLVSRDRRVKPPLDVLWYGGAVDMIYPDWDFTHSRGPTPLVAGGRMFLQVFPTLHAIDPYTGRHLWATPIPGTAQDSKRRNVNYVATHDSVYVNTGTTCVRLDAARGGVVLKIKPPALNAPLQEIKVWTNSLFAVAGTKLICMDRRTGRETWRYEAQHNLVAYAVGSGRVFCVDALLPDRRGKVTKAKGSIRALDVARGGTIWERPLDVTGTKHVGPRLAYAETNDVLLVVYRSTNAYRGMDGSPLWGGTMIEGTDEPMLHRNRLITQHGEMYEIHTGRRIPVQLWRGKPNTNWDAGGVRGCNRAIASEYLGLIRDGHASFFNLESGQQTFFRGVRSGCTNSLIAAGGLLNAPNFSHGCSCNYAVFASLALMRLQDWYLHAGQEPDARDGPE